MTLLWTKDGQAECDFRVKGVSRLHLRLGTTAKREAKTRHDAVQVLVKQRRLEMLDQLRRRVLTVERVTAMVQGGEPLAPIAEAVASPGAEPDAGWGTVDEAGVRYLAWMRAHPRKAARTTELAGFQLQAFVDFEYEGGRIGALPLDRVPSRAVQAYQDSLIAAGKPANSITTYMARPGALWRWATEQEAREAREERRPARPIYSPVDGDLLFRETHRRDRVLTKEEAERLMARTPEPLLFAVGCGLLAGLRVGEMLHLRPGLDVDVELGTITIRDQPDWKTKTRRSRRLVPMSDVLKGIATRHLARYADASWMVPSPVLPGRPLTEDALRLEMKAIVEGCGLIYGRAHPQGVVYHTLRHSFASHAIMRGVDLYTVAKLLGDSLKMVEDVYADLSPDFKRAAVKKLAGAFNLSGIDTANDTE